MASTIQSDVLPTNFPGSSMYGLYARMVPAKDIGGDFYDFFEIDSDHVGLVMADVSGKGVPAALFMVITKTLIRNRSYMGGTPAEILADVNEQLCENNTAELFVAVWLSIVTLSTGEMKYVNAGLEYPALKRADGKYEITEAENYPPLATMEEMEFEDTTIMLEDDDRLFLYTDGITKAKNFLGKRYGIDRLLKVLNGSGDSDPKALLTAVSRSLDEFVGKEERIDDISMMSFHYYGK